MAEERFFLDSLTLAIREFVPKKNSLLILREYSYTPPAINDSVGVSSI